MIGRGILIEHVLRYLNYNIEIESKLRIYLRTFLHACKLIFFYLFK